MKCTSIFFSLLVIATFVVAQPNYDFTKLKREHLGRGVIAIRENPSTVVVSWRYLSSDPMDESWKKVAFFSGCLFTFLPSRYISKDSSIGSEER